MPPTLDNVQRSWSCAACQARIASAAAPVACPLCGGALAIESGAAAHLLAPVVRVRHDRAAFARSALAFLATCVEIPDEVVASVAVPDDLVPLYVPFRRTWAPVRDGVAAAPDGAAPRAACQVDVCAAPGLDAREATALEAIVAGYAPTEFSTETPVGSVLLGKIPEPRPRAAHPGAGSTVAGEIYYRVPVWVLTVPYPGRRLRLLMDAGSGRFAGFMPASTAARQSAAYAIMLGHWAWLPALFCLLLAALIDVATVRGALCALAAATLLGGYSAAIELTRARTRARKRLAVAVARMSGEGDSDAAPARRRLVVMHRAVAWLPGIYAGIAVGAHLGVTAYVAGHAAELSAGSPEAASLVPWSPAEPNLRVSPFAATGASRIGLPGHVELGPAPAEQPVSGHVITVGHGGYADLAAAVAAADPGDTISIGPGRYDGPRLLIRKDVAIEGRGDVSFVWRGGRGPFIRIAGRGTRVSFAHLRFEAYGINTAVIGDPNAAYGEPPSGSGQVVVLRDVAIDSPQASAIYSTSPGARYVVEGGQYRGAGSAIIVIDAAELVIRPYRGAPTRISTDGTSGVAHNAVGLAVNGTRLLTIDSVQWSGDPGGDIAIQGDAVVVNLRRAAEPSGAQRVLLVDDRGAARREIEASADAEPLRFSVQGGELRPLSEPGPGETRLQ